MSTTSQLMFRSVLIGAVKARLYHSFFVRHSSNIRFCGRTKKILSVEEGLEIVLLSHVHPSLVSV